MDEITLAHRDLLSSRFRGLNLKISEYNFSNLYLFRQLHQYRLWEHEDLLFVRGVTRGGKSFLLPTFPLATLESNRLLSLISGVDFFYPIPDEWSERLDPRLFKAEFVERDSDYLFTRLKMATYPGRHLSPKRNLVKQFLTHYNSRIEPLTHANRSVALSVLEQWQQHQELDQSKTDFSHCQEALGLMDPLQLSGSLFFANDKPCAFVIGEKSDHECYIIHFAKALKEYKGIYQYLYQALAQSLDQEIEFINLEQDLGSPQVHQAKHSYHPDLMIRKWRVSPL